MEFKEKYTKSITETQAVLDFVATTKGAADRDYTDTAAYRSKLLHAYNQRLGNRENLDEPWPDAPNVSMPWTDKLIRKQIPVFVSAGYNPKQPAVVDVQEGVADEGGVLKQKAKKAEKLLNHFLRNQKDLLKKVTLAANYVKEKGRGYFYLYAKSESRYDSKTLNFKAIERSFDVQREQAITQLEAQARRRLTDEELGQANLPPTGEDQIAAMKLLSEKELMQILLTLPEFQFNPEDEQDAKNMKQIIEDFKKGEESSSFVEERVIIKPYLDSLSSEFVLPGTGSPQDVQECWRVSMDFFLNSDELWQLAEHGVYNKETVRNFFKTPDKAARSDNSIEHGASESQKRINEGAFGLNDEIYQIREVHTYWKKEDEVSPQKYVLTYFLGDKKNNYLRLIKEPTPGGQFPLVEIDNEVREDRAYASRGIPEMVRFVQETIDSQQNNRIIRDVIQNVPMFTVRRSAGITADDIKFIPGQGIPLDNPNDVNFFSPMKSVDSASERIEAMQKSYGEELIGDIDFAFGRSSSLARGGGAKTLGEIQVAQGEGQKIAALDLIFWNQALSRAYQMYFDILKDVFEGEVYLDGETITANDLNFPAEVRSNGSIEDADKVFKAQKSLMRYQLVAQSDPTMVTPDDRYNALFDYLERDGVDNPERYITDPKEVMRDQSAQMQQQLAQGQQSLKLLTDQLDQKEKELGQVEKKIRTKENKGS